MANNPMSNSKIASNFKKLRAQKGYSLEKMARLADLSLNTVIRIESGVNKNPTIWDAHQARPRAWSECGRFNPI